MAFLNGVVIGKEGCIVILVFRQIKGNVSEVPANS